MMEPNDEDLERFRGIMKRKLSEKRFLHSCNVSDEAVKLAKLYGADVSRARFAGLVHDITKEEPVEAQLQTIAKYSIILDEVEKTAPKLLHAITGAAVLEREYGVGDRDILNAVRYHTTARAGMSLLEKILYLADYISAERDYEGVDGLRRAIYTSLDTGMNATLDFSVAELLGKGVPIHLDTVRARNEQILSGRAKRA